MAFQSTPLSLSLHAHGKVESQSHRCLNRFLPDCLSHVSRGGKSQSSRGEGRFSSMYRVRKKMQPRGCIQKQSAKKISPKEKL